MMKSFRIGLIFLVSAALFLPVHAVRADIGPKPTMEFRFKADSGAAEVSITSGELLECDQPDCSDAKPLPELGPQGFSCEADTCSALAYGFSTYHKLSIQFSDGVTRESNIFKTAQFDSIYDVAIGATDLQVKVVNHFSVPQLPLPYVMLALCGIAALVILIIIVMVVVLLIRRNRKK